MKKLTFRELALKALGEFGSPATPEELWVYVVEKDWHNTYLNTNGKTPKASFNSELYTMAKGGLIGAYEEEKGAKKFYLPDKSDYFPIKSDVAPVLKPSKKTEHERGLHPILAYFLKQNDNFNAYSKTIFHEKSLKSSKGKDKWLHPDMVAVNFEYANYQQKKNVINFIKKVDFLPLKIFSFELKKELTLSNFKESFFQAVSNSSWANEGYLVAATITEDNQLIEALQKLSQSFGIGVLHLNIEKVEQSTIIAPARFKEKMDYSVVNELAIKNDEFSEFLKTVCDFSPEYSGRFESEFDPIMTVDELNQHLIKYKN